MRGYVGETSVASCRLTWVQYVRMKLKDCDDGERSLPSSILLVLLRRRVVSLGPTCVLLRIQVDP